MVNGTDEWVDPVLDPLLEKAVTVQACLRRLDQPAYSQGCPWW